MIYVPLEQASLKTELQVRQYFSERKNVDEHNSKIKVADGLKGVVVSSLIKNSLEKSNLYLEDWQTDLLADMALAKDEEISFNEQNSVLNLVREYNEGFANIIIENNPHERLKPDILQELDKLIVAVNEKKQVKNHAKESEYFGKKCVVLEKELEDIYLKTINANKELDEAKTPIQEAEAEQLLRDLRKKYNDKEQQLFLCEQLEKEHYLMSLDLDLSIKQDGSYMADFESKKGFFKAQINSTKKMLEKAKNNGLDNTGITERYEDKLTVLEAQYRGAEEEFQKAFETYKHTPKGILETTEADFYKLSSHEEAINQAVQNVKNNRYTLEQIDQSIRELEANKDRKPKQANQLDIQLNKLKVQKNKLKGIVALGTEPKERYKELLNKKRTHLEEEEYQELTEALKGSKINTKTFKERFLGKEGFISTSISKSFSQRKQDALAYQKNPENKMNTYAVLLATSPKKSLEQIKKQKEATVQRNIQARALLFDYKKLESKKLKENPQRVKGPKPTPEELRRAKIIGIQKSRNILNRICGYPFRGKERQNLKQLNRKIELLNKKTKLGKSLIKMKHAFLDLPSSFTKGTLKGSGAVFTTGEWVMREAFSSILPRKYKNKVRFNLKYRIKKQLGFTGFSHHSKNRKNLYK